MCNNLFIIILPLWKLCIKLGFIWTFLCIIIECNQSIFDYHSSTAFYFLYLAGISISKDVTLICIINGFRNAEIGIQLSIGTECNNSENKIENDLPDEIAGLFISDIEAFRMMTVFRSWEINFIVVSKSLFGKRNICNFYNKILIYWLIK